MKKIAVFVLLLGACVLNAEEMRFVTTLSSPLGTFAQLETADPSALSSVPLVNFCNSRASAGTVTLQGADTYIQTLALKNATVLGGNTPEYRISGALSVNNNSEVTGGRLLANAATVSGASSAKSKVEDTLYAASLKVKGAKTAVKLIQKKDKVSSFCNDVIGDICGIISGSAGALIASSISVELKVNILIVSLIVTALIASLTIGGKALGKSYAVNKGNIIIFRFSHILAKFVKE